MTVRSLCAVLTLVLAAFAATAARGASGSDAAEAFAYCRKVGTDSRVRPLPPALVPSFRRAFGLHAPDEYVMRTGFVRCADGAVLGCGVGANLPCGPADTRRDIPGADAWCRENHDPAMIPAYVTGHASIYAWRCEAGRAVPVKPVARVDAQGFVAAYWRRLRPP